ncbi:MAG: VanZ family protein [Solibacillus sp.]
MISVFLKAMAMYCIVATPIYIYLRRAFMRRRLVSWYREFCMLLFVWYSVAIFSQTIIPRLSISADGISILRASYARSNFELFHTIQLYAAELNGPIAQIAFYNLAGNVVLFIPFGLFIPLLWKKTRTPLMMLVTALGIPVFIEGTQYFIGRSVDIDDVLLNAVAIVMGYALFYAVKKIISKKGCNN